MPCIKVLWERSIKSDYPYKVEETVTITYKSNYTDGPADTVQIVEKGVATNLIANTFSRTGFELEYWSVDGSGNIYYDKASVPCRLILCYTVLQGFLSLVFPLSETIIKSKTI